MGHCAGWRSGWSFSIILVGPPFGGRNRLHIWRAAGGNFLIPLVAPRLEDLTNRLQISLLPAFGRVCRDKETAKSTLSLVLRCFRWPFRPHVHGQCAEQSKAQVRSRMFWW